MTPPPRLVSQVTWLLHEISAALTQPDDYLAIVNLKPIGDRVDRMNFIATRLRKYVERQVLEYISTCIYVDHSTWLRKPRVTAEVIDFRIRLTVLGLRGVVIHSVEFAPTVYAHTKPYFKNTICQ